MPLSACIRKEGLKSSTQVSTLTDQKKTANKIQNEFKNEIFQVIAEINEIEKDKQ